MRDKPRPVTTRPGWAWAAIGDTVKQLGQGRVTVSCFRALFAYLSMQWASQMQSILLVGVLHCYFGLVHFHLWILLENCNGHHRNTLSFWVCLVYFGLRILSENCNGHHRSSLSWLVGSVILAWFILAWEFYQKIAKEHTFCHDITGAMCLSGWCILLLFWLGLFFACEFVSEKKIAMGSQKQHIHLFWGLWTFVMTSQEQLSFWLVCFVVILAWFILFLSIFIRFKKNEKKCNGITEAIYPSILGVVNFCHDITGAIYLFWLGLFFACEFLSENCKGHHRSNLSICFGGCVLLSWHCMSQLAIHINKLSINPYQ